MNLMRCGVVTCGRRVTRVMCKMRECEGFACMHEDRRGGIVEVFILLGLLLLLIYIYILFKGYLSFSLYGIGFFLCNLMYIICGVSRI